MPEIQEILQRYGEAFIQKHRLSFVQRKAWNAILHCRTSKLGGHLDKCPHCGYEHPSYNSCRNRNCPKCQTFAKERWIDARKEDLLNVGYFHVVFTVPQELNVLIYRNQQACYNLLFRCAAETLRKLAGDKKYLGGAIGLTAVLHTWGQNFCFHPHVHCIVPSGGLTTLGKWKSSRKKFFSGTGTLSQISGKISGAAQTENPGYWPIAAGFVLPERMGGVLQTALQKRGLRGGIPWPLYAPRRHLQQSYPEDWKRCCYL